MKAPDPVRLLTKQCNTCIYVRNGELMHLTPTRLAEMTAESIAADTNVICHKSLHVSGEFPWDVWCKGNLDEKGPGQMMRITDRLDMLQEVDPPMKGTTSIRPTT